MVDINKVAYGIESKKILPSPSPLSLVMLGKKQKIRLAESAILTNDVELYSPDEIPGPDRNQVTEQILK
nr:9570_t:CDS:2 [Entrophospora candida]